MSAHQFRAPGEPPPPKPPKFPHKWPPNAPPNRKPNWVKRKVRPRLEATSPPAAEPDDRTLRMRWAALLLYLLPDISGWEDEFREVLNLPAEDEA